MQSPGKILRLSKVLDPDDGRGVVVAADHGFMLGSIEGVFNLEKTLRRVIEGRPEAVLLSPGQAARLGHLFHGRKSPAILVRADWTNAFRTKTYTLPTRTIGRAIAASARDALTLGASGIVTYYFIGCSDEIEAQNFRLMATFARECDEIGLPFIVEPLPFGERVTGANHAELILTSVRMAVEAGADAIKTSYTGDVETFRNVVKSVSVPILVLGGAKARTMRDALEVVAEVLEAGASGVVYGRQVVQAEDPAEFVRSVRAVVHEGKSVREVISKARAGPIVLKVDAAKCTGCMTCEIACTFSRKEGFSPTKARLRIESVGLGKYNPVVCTLCGLCVKACEEGALTFDPKLGYIQLLKKKCTGCRKCVEACPFDLVLFDNENKKPLICDRCKGAPECVEWCQPKALVVVYRKGRD